MSCTAFLGDRMIATGEAAEVALAVKRQTAEDPSVMVLIFEDATGKQVDFDLRGSDAEIVARISPPKGPGRPKMGVVAREVTLLQSHWDWLNGQPGGASAALRRLVHEAKRGSNGGGKEAKERAYRFLSAMAGNLPSFEEASRALFAGDLPRLEELMRDWPSDVQAHALKLLAE